MTKRMTSARAADLMRAGSVLRQMHTRTGLKWFIVPGCEVTEKVAAELLERPDVQPSGDGLFPGISQTFRLGQAGMPDTGKPSQSRETASAYSNDDVLQR